MQQVQCNTWTTQRDQRHFTDPLRFAPERWIDAERDPKWNHVPGAFITFGIGSFVCIGRGLAMQELRLITTRLFRAFDMELAPGFDHDDFWRNVRSWQAMFKPPIPAIFRRRDVAN
jgi:cytochrome P450